MPWQINGNFGKCIFIDCMDKDYGLPSIKERFNMAIADMPYNIDAKITQGMHYNHQRDESVITYEDKIDQTAYYDWCKGWYSVLNQITDYGYLFSGFSNIGFWTWVMQCEYMIWYRENSGIRTFNAFFNAQEPIITYGKPNRKPERDVIRCDLQNGFLTKGKHKYKHPHPKPFELFFTLAESTRATSVIDPFLGSGTTAEVCESLGIKWLGFELKEDFIEDVEYRISQGIKKYQILKKTGKLGDY